MAHEHYYKNVKHLDHIDVYRVLQLFNVTDPCTAHAIKKLLCAGRRDGGKSEQKDIQEASASLKRQLEMLAEDKVGLPAPAPCPGVDMSLPPGGIAPPVVHHNPMGTVE